MHMDKMTYQGISIKLFKKVKSLHRFRNVSGVKYVRLTVNIITQSSSVRSTLIKKKHSSLPSQFNKFEIQENHNSLNAEGKTVQNDTTVKCF